MAVPKEVAVVMEPGTRRMWPLPLAALRSATVDDDAELVQRLRAGDEAAFVAIVERYHGPLLRLALAFVRSPAVAEEVVQDTWLAVVRGIERFEGRASFKTWLFRILVNRARTTGVRERRQDPRREPAVTPHRFNRSGQWADPPVAWPDDAEDRIVARDNVQRVVRCLDELPESQRQVVVLRDFEQLGAQEVCGLLGISEGNQRVLLHRGRSRIRGILEREIGKG